MVARTCLNVTFIRTLPVFLKAELCQKCSVLSNFDTCNTLQGAENSNLTFLLILSEFSSPPDSMIMEFGLEISFLCKNSTCMAIGGGALPLVLFVHLIFMCIHVMCHETGVIAVCLSL